MKANEAPEKIYMSPGGILYKGDKQQETDIEYNRTDAFIERAAEFIYNYNQKQILKHGARATHGCGKYTINVYDFKKYMKGE